ncbi:MAG: type III-B CRISPR module-associated Cmr3 family protein [Desulfurococcales archaeon]|jgi:hypothetical protein|nr:type III-B CRISPR module-associated Cmr3 family protein [Desulfurococcales archaeon]
MSHAKAVKRLVEIGYIEPIHIRKHGDPSPITVGPSSHGLNAPYITPRTILGAIVTSMIELGILGHSYIDNVKRKVTDLRAYSVLRDRYKAKVAGPPYVLIRYLSNAENEKIYIFTWAGPIGLDDLFNEIDRTLKSVSKNIGIEDLAEKIWRSLSTLLTKPDNMKRWSIASVRVSLQDPERVAKEGYLFSRSYLALGKAFREKLGGSYIYMPIEVESNIEDLDRMKSPTLIRIGGGSRLAYLKILDREDPLLEYLLRKINKQDDYKLVLIQLASPFPAPDSLRRGEIVKRFIETVMDVVNGNCSRSYREDVYASRIHVDQHPEGWDLERDVRRPYSAWILPGSAVLTKLCGQDLSHLLRAMYTGAYIDLDANLEKLWEDYLGYIREFIYEGYGRFIVIPIGEKARG